ncbi:MAG: protocatechuate 3,4-dioxygenase subunit alpha [Burkholderiaceae bacterium]
MRLKQTPSQTVGPYFAYGLTSTQYGYPLASLFGAVLADRHAAGRHLRIIGQVLDGQGQPVDDALVEIAQPDATGRWPASTEEIAASGFRGFGRMGTGTEADRRFEFRTVMPGVATPGEAPFVLVILTMRGMLNHAFTRIYFDGEAANASDPVLTSVPAERRHTLIAQRADDGQGIVYRFDIRMQGPDETVFFDV